MNIILPEASKKSSELLGREEPDLAPVITQIMNAVFLEEVLSWEKGGFHVSGHNTQLHC